MIFVSVGAQMPFDRLIRAVDRWAELRSRSDVLAQIGDTDYRPQHIAVVRFVDPLEFRQQVQHAEIVVAHAGMGSIITALEFGKPIIVMPRRGDLAETRNDHQVATAMHFAATGSVAAALTEEELIEKLDRASLLRGQAPIDVRASDRLLTTIRRFLDHRPLSLDSSGAAGVPGAGR